MTARAAPIKVTVLGAGKVGRGLARAARAVGVDVTLRAARRELPRTLDADLVVLAVRDAALGTMAKELVERGLLAPGTACVHVAGALDASALAPLREAGVPCAQMHPMISFASRARTPSLAGAHVHVRGDAAAERRARAFVRALGMVPRTFPDLDAVGYHAAAGLVANGAAALAAMGCELLMRAGVKDPRTPARMLGPLLRSVAENVEALGFPDALTGPVRRGDRGAVERHAARLRALFPEALPLYLASAAAQLPLARALGEADPQNFDALATWLRRAQSLKQ